MMRIGGKIKDRMKNIIDMVFEYLSDSYGDP